MQKSTFIVGNWKMNKTLAEAKEFISALTRHTVPSHTQVALAVSHTLIAEAAKIAAKTNVAIGSQDVSCFSAGAYSGDVSAMQVNDAGGSFTLIGHSERRLYHYEDDQSINQKLHMAMAANLSAIICVGESWQVKEEGQTQDLLDRQIQGALKDITKDQMTHISFAYEPIWAIGTGRTPTPLQIQTAQNDIRNTVKRLYEPDISCDLKILYGGSVKAVNAFEIISQKDVNGLLVGGASLVFEEFKNILTAK